MKEKLTKKQKLFCKEYLKDLNGTRAAIAAGYSEKSAKMIAHENLTKPYLSDYIQSINKERLERCEIDADWVLKEAVRCFKLSAKTTITEGEEVILDPRSAKGFLELVGKHIKVGAFQDIVKSEVTEKKSLDDLYD